VIYVDELKFGKRKWCHMMTDGDIEELHHMAKQIGLKKSWFQDNPLHPHYDLTSNKRLIAIRFGAKDVTSKELVIRCSKYNPHRDGTS